MRREPVVAADLHREPEFAFVHVVRECRRDVVQRSETNLIAHEKDRVVLGMGVRADHQPIPCERIDEPRHRFIGSARRHRLAKERHNLFGSGSPLALILGGRRHAEGLTDVFLMDPPDTSVARNPVVALDDDGTLVTKMRDPGSSHQESRAAPRIHAEVLVEVVVVKTRHRRLQDVARGCGA